MFEWNSKGMMRAFSLEKKLNEKSITQISESEQAGTYKSENLPDYIN